MVLHWSKDHVNEYTNYKEMHELHTLLENSINTKVVTDSVNNMQVDTFEEVVDPKEQDENVSLLKDRAFIKYFDIDSINPRNTYR